MLMFVFLETAHNLFLSCSVFTPIWCMVISWISVSSADSDLLQDHLVQFIHSSEGSRACHILSFSLFIMLYLGYVESAEQQSFQD